MTHKGASPRHRVVSGVRYRSPAETETVPSIAASVASSIHPFHASETGTLPARPNALIVTVAGRAGERPTVTSRSAY